MIDESINNSILNTKVKEKVIADMIERSFRRLDASKVAN